MTLEKKSVVRKQYARNAREPGESVVEKKMMRKKRMKKEGTTL